MNTRTIGSFVCGILLSVNVLAQTNANDPYESFNRKMYDFNDSVDSYVAAPLANGYKFITPSFVQTGIFNFFNNLKGLNVALNDVLQAKFSQSTVDFGRFTLNSTVGLGGFFDVAKQIGLEQNEEDFDQTLAVWGVPQGAYLVLPFVGPMTVRSAHAAPIDAATNPASYVSLYVGYLSAPIQFMSGLNARSNAEGSLKFLNEAAMDKYVFTRESFLQWRKNLETDGKVSASLDDDLMLEEKNIHGKWLDYGKQFESVSRSFGHVAQQFDLSSQNYEQINLKIEHLKHRSRF